MGRPSKLTPKKWAELFREAELGIPQKDLAKKYKISTASVSKGVLGFRNSVLPAVDSVMEGERKMAALNPGERLAADSIIDVRRTIMNGMAEAAVYGAKTAAHLQKIAHRRIATVQGLGPKGELTEAEVRAASEGRSLLQVANEAATVPLRLIEADLKRESPVDSNLYDKSDDDLIDELNEAEDRLQLLEGEG
jgi:carboxylesterase type B